jgi:hypothetical protein
MRKRPRRPDVWQARLGRGRVLAGNCIGQRFTVLDPSGPCPSAPALFSRLNSAFEARHCPAPWAVLGASDQVRLEDRAGNGTRAAPLGASGSSNWPIMVSGTGVEVP